MQNLFRLITALVVTVALSPSASSQYVVKLNDGTRVRVEDSQLSFSGDGASLETSEGSIALADVASIETAAAADAPIVLAYHPYYSYNMPRADIVTHINYSFAEVYVRDNVYQKFKLQGTTNAFKRVVALKDENPNLKILLSFSHTVVNGDNKQDGGFSAIAASEENRKAFAQDCLDFVEKYGIDGIDLDWEFPGLSWSGAACDPANDVANYTLLLKQLRETLGHHYLLTYAGYCMDKKTTTGGWKYIDLAESEPWVDYVNIMTYDLDTAPHYHNAIKSQASYWDIERTVKAYTKAGFPLDKVTLGIPFYARASYNSGGAIAYSKINTLSESDGYVVDNWNEYAQVPYITLNGVMYGSYDNPRSIDLKAAYARANGIKGLFYWCTHEDDKDYTLSKAVWESMKTHYGIEE